MQRIKRRLVRAALLVAALLTALLLLGAVFAGGAQAATYSSEEVAFLHLINDYRVSLGLQPLLMSDKLSESGDRHDSDMAKYHFFDHFTEASDWFANGASPWDRMAASGYNYNTCKGENLAAGIGDAESVFEAWKNSSGHNSTMTKPEFRVIGVSFVYVSGSEYGFYWTTDFGGYVDPTAHSFGGSPSGTGFSDVVSGTLYSKQIAEVAGKGVVSGYGDGTFGPYDAVTRQQFAKMILLALGDTVPKVSNCVFMDVPMTSGSGDPLYPASYVAACVEKGITVGKTARTFDPYGSVTRAQAITMVARALDLPEPPAWYEPPFPDFSSDHYPWARRAAYAGLLDDFVGMGPNFDFCARATRGEVCLLLAELLDE